MQATYLSSLWAGIEAQLSTTCNLEKVTAYASGAHSLQYALINLRGPRRRGREAMTIFVLQPLLKENRDTRRDRTL